MDTPEERQREMSRHVHTGRQGDGSKQNAISSTKQQHIYNTPDTNTNTGAYLHLSIYLILLPTSTSLSPSIPIDLQSPLDIFDPIPQ